MKRVLTIGGVDPCCGAGITADARMIALRGAEALTVVSCLTVQNRHSFSRVQPVEASLLGEAIDAVFADGPVHAVKTGLIADPALVVSIADRIGRHPDVPLVVDPVASATVGGFSVQAELIGAYRDWLLPVATVVTPNLDELALLGGLSSLLATGVESVLVKDGHGTGVQAIDRLVTLKREWEFAHERIDRGPVHGTGCALSAALAVCLANGEGLPEACEHAIDALMACLRATPDGELAESIRIV